MQKLNIITPVTRPANIPGMYHDIEKNCSADMNIIWWLVFDCSVKEQGNEWKEKFTHVSNQNLLINVMISENEHAADVDHINHVLGKMEDAFEFDQELGDEWVCIMYDSQPFLHLSFVDTMVANKDAQISGYNDLFRVIDSDREITPFKLRLLNGDRLDDNDNSVYRLLKILFDRNNENQKNR